MIKQWRNKKNEKKKKKTKEQTFRGTVNVNGSHLLGCNLKNLKTHVKHVHLYTDQSITKNQRVLFEIRLK